MSESQSSAGANRPAGAGPWRLLAAAWPDRVADARLPLGLRGERFTARYLRRKGYLIAAGGRRSRYGEIDLVAIWRKDVVVFVEVKTRRSTFAGHPAESIDAAKQRRLCRTGLEFLKSYGLLEHPARFDVAALVWPRGRQRPEWFAYYENAFQPEANWQMFL